LHAEEDRKSKAESDRQERGRDMKHGKPLRTEKKRDSATQKMTKG